MGDDQLKLVKNLFLGSEDGSEIDLAKAFEKYINMREVSLRFIKVIDILNNMEFIKCRETEHTIVTEYAKTLKNAYNTIYSFDITGMQHIVDSFPLLSEEETETANQFKKFYVNCKDNVLETTILQYKSNMLPFVTKTSVSPGELWTSKDFIYDTNSSFCPVPDLELNFHLLYIDCNDDDKKLIVLLLNKLYTLSNEICTLNRVADIDPMIFVNAIDYTMGLLRKQVSRCDEAFNKIISSTQLLYKNFDQYYEKFVQTKNSATIMEAYLKDVAATFEKNTKLSMQFKTIMINLNNLVNTKIHDPKVRNMLGTIITKHTKELDNQDEKIEDTNIE